MGSCHETSQCYLRHCEMVLADMKEPGADPSLFTIISLESVIEECPVVLFIPFLMAMFDDEPVEEVPFVVSICATAPFVRCDTGVPTGASDILSLVMFAWGLQLFSNNFLWDHADEERLAVRELIEYTVPLWCTPIQRM